MSRRLAALLLTLVLAWPGCGPERADRTLVLWHAYRGAELKALTRLVRRFNQQGGARVRLLQISFDNLPNKITNAIPRGHGPDLFIFPHDRLGDWVAKGYVEPVGYWVDAKRAARFLPKTLAALAVGKRIYGLPLSYKSVALFYHTDLIGAEPPATTEEMIRRGRAFMKKQGRGHFGLVYEAADTYFHAPWLLGMGGRFLGPGGRPPLDSAAGIRAMQFARRLAGPKGIVPAEVTGQLVTSLFTTRKAAMAITGPWFLSDLRGQGRSLRYRVAPLPRVGGSRGRRAAPLLTVEGLYLSSRSRNKPQAFEVMDFLTSDQSALAFVREARQVPANRAADRAVADPRSKLHDPALAAFRAQLEFAHLTPKTPLMRVIWEPYKKALGAVINRGEDPKGSLEKAIQEIQRVVGPCLKARGR